MWAWVQMSSRTWSTLSPTWAIARSSSAIDPGSCMPVSTSTTPSPAAIAHALQCGTPGSGSGRRKRQSPGMTRSPRPSSCLRGMPAHDIPRPPRLGARMSSADVATRYFEALAAHDIDAAIDAWTPGGVERVVGQREMTAPADIRAFLGELFGAFPDLEYELLEVTAADGRAAVRWRARGTFAGPGAFQGFRANGARLDMEGCDVLSVSGEGKIERLDAYLDSGDVARQLGLLPPAGSRAEARLTQLANARTRARSWIQGSDPERIAEGVWLVRGGIPKTMNVYLIEDGDGVTVFDCGVSDMAAPLAAAAARLGGIKRIVLGHVDADHRGAAPELNATAYCHQAELAAAE